MVQGWGSQPLRIYLVDFLFKGGNDQSKGLSPRYHLMLLYTMNKNISGIGFRIQSVFTIIGHFLIKGGQDHPWGTLPSHYLMAFVIRNKNIYNSGFMILTPFEIHGNFYFAVTGDDPRGKICWEIQVVNNGNTRPGKYYLFSFNSDLLGSTIFLYLFALFNVNHKLRKYDNNIKTQFYMFSHFNVSIIKILHSPITFYKNTSFSLCCFFHPKIFIIIQKTK